MSLTMKWNGYDPGMAGGEGEFRVTTDDGFLAKVWGSGCYWAWDVWKDKMLRDENTDPLTRSYNAKVAAERAIRRLRKEASK